MNRRDLTGKKYSRLTPLFQDGRSPTGRLKWKCECDCGNFVNVSTSDIINGHTRSCGCLMIETASIIHKKTGESRSKLYWVWWSMKKRCTWEKHTGYKNYGGRGISVCDEWASFENFFKWAKQNGYAEGLTIDRINNDGNYEPSNCRWVTMLVQASNRRKKK